jgi:uridine monophosphate synthetase
MSGLISDVANALYKSGCLKFGSFRIKSGALSPYYIDLASLLSSPQDMCRIVQIAADTIDAMREADDIDKIASIELKGALLVPSIACKLNLPCVIVRKEEKAYGVTGRIAGATVSKGDRIIFFDDVISEGLSKLEGMKPLEALGGQIKNLVVVVDREQGGKEKLENLGYKVSALAQISELVKSLREANHISLEQETAVMQYIKEY